MFLKDRNIPLSTSLCNPYLEALRALIELLFFFSLSLSFLSHLSMQKIYRHGGFQLTNFTVCFEHSLAVNAWSVHGFDL